MNSTNIVRDGKWYLLLFDEYAKFLVDKTNYDVYMISFDKPMIKVTKDNFQKLSENVKSFSERQVMGDCFVMELELPSMKIEVINRDDDKSKVTFNSHTKVFQGYSFDLPEVWKYKMIDDEWLKQGRNFVLDTTKNELDEKIVKYNNGDI